MPPPSPPTAPSTAVAPPAPIVTLTGPALVEAPLRPRRHHLADGPGLTSTVAPRLRSAVVLMALAGVIGVVVALILTTAAVLLVKMLGHATH